MKYHKHSSILAIKEKNVTVYFLYLLKLSKLSLKKDIKDCDRVVLEIYLGYKYQWPQEDLNFESFTYDVVTWATRL